MGVKPGKKQVKKKVLTKRDKMNKRVARVNKAVLRKKQERQVKKKKASSNRRKLK